MPTLVAYPYQVRDEFSLSDPIIESTGAAPSDLEDAINTEDGTHWLDFEPVTNNVRAVFEFDLSALPEGSIPTGVQLEFCIERGGGSTSGLKVRSAAVDGNDNLILGPDERPIRGASGPPRLERLVQRRTLAKGELWSNFGNICAVVTNFGGSDLTGTQGHFCRLIWLRVVVEYAGAPPAAVSPSLSGTIAVPTECGWRYEQEDGVPQTHYRVAISPGSDAVSDPESFTGWVFDTGKTQGASTRTVSLVDNPLPDGDYRQYVKVWGRLSDGSVVASAWVSSSFTVASAPPRPAAPALVSAGGWDSLRGGAAVTVDPLGAGSRVQMQRSIDGGRSWVNVDASQRGYDYEALIAKHQPEFLFDPADAPSSDALSLPNRGSAGGDLEFGAGSTAGRLIAYEGRGGAFIGPDGHLQNTTGLLPESMSVVRWTANFEPGDRFRCQMYSLDAARLHMEKTSDTNVNIIVTNGATFDGISKSFGGTNPLTANTRWLQAEIDLDNHQARIRSSESETHIRDDVTWGAWAAWHDFTVDLNNPEGHAINSYITSATEAFLHSAEFEADDVRVCGIQYGTVGADGVIDDYVVDYGDTGYPTTLPDRSVWILDGAGDVGFLPESFSDLLATKTESWTVVTVLRPPMRGATYSDMVMANSAGAGGVAGTWLYYVGNIDTGSIQAIAYHGTDSAFARAIYPADGIGKPLAMVWRYNHETDTVDAAIMGPDGQLYEAATTLDLSSQTVEDLTTEHQWRFGTTAAGSVQLNAEVRIPVAGFQRYITDADLLELLPAMIESGSVGTVRDFGVPLDTSAIYRVRTVNADGDAVSDWVLSATPATIDTETLQTVDPLDGRENAWWILVPADQTLNLQPIVETYEEEEMRVSAVTVGYGGNAVSLSPNLGRRNQMAVYTRNRAERQRVEALLNSGHPFRLVDVFGDSGWFKLAGSVRKKPWRAAPLPSETTGLRDFHVLSFDVIEVREPGT